MVVIKTENEREREKRNALHLPQKKKRRTVKTSKRSCRNHLVGRTSLAYKRARGLHAHAVKRKTNSSFAAASVRPCKKRKITMMMIYEKESKREKKRKIKRSKNNDSRWKISILRSLFHYYYF